MRFSGLSVGPSRFFPQSIFGCVLKSPLNLARYRWDIWTMADKDGKSHREVGNAHGFISKGELSGILFRNPNGNGRNDLPWQANGKKGVVASFGRQNGFLGYRNEKRPRIFRSLLRRYENAFLFGCGVFFQGRGIFLIHAFHDFQSNIQIRVA